MRINEFSSINLRPTLIPNTDTITTNVIDKVLLFLIASIGILGSLYVFSISTGNSNSNHNYQNSTLLATANSGEVSNAILGKNFGDFVKIDGKKQVGEKLTFKFLGDRNEARYVMDMGNGERVIITSNEFPYTFTESGNFTLELKTINRGLVNIVASKEIKIKD